MPYVEEKILINGDIAEVYAMAVDMEKFPEYMPDVESVTVLSRDGDTTTTEWVTNVEGTPIIWTEIDEFDHAAHVIRYRLIEGDLDKFEGEWRFERVGEQTRVTLGVDYDFGIPNLTELIGPTLEVKVRENSQMMLSAMKEHVESRAETEPARATIPMETGREAGREYDGGVGCADPYLVPSSQEIAKA
ncbi:MAG: cyclase [Armatimonadetes bacterium]|nr:cyclase [Armatimonadota bacterium]